MSRSSLVHTYTQLPIANDRRSIPRHVNNDYTHVSVPWPIRRNKVIVDLYGQTNWIQPTFISVRIVKRFLNFAFCLRFNYGICGEPKVEPSQTPDEVGPSRFVWNEKLELKRR